MSTVIVIDYPGVIVNGFYCEDLFELFVKHNRLSKFPITIVAHKRRRYNKNFIEWFEGHYDCETWPTVTVEGDADFQSAIYNFIEANKKDYEEEPWHFNEEILEQNTPAKFDKHYEEYDVEEDAKIPYDNFDEENKLMLCGQKNKD